MADLTAARSPPLLPAAGALQVLPPATRHVLRGGPGVRIRAENALGFEVPASACRAAVSGERAALWLGPDEWLLIAPAAGTEATTNALRRSAGEPAAAPWWTSATARWALW